MRRRSSAVACSSSRACCQARRCRCAGYDAVVSNSLLHHLHDPAVFWRAVREAGAARRSRAGDGPVPPPSPAAAQAIVDQYAANEPEVLRRGFLRIALRGVRARRDSRATAGLLASTDAAGADRFRPASARHGTPARSDERLHRLRAAGTAASSAGWSRCGSARPCCPTTSGIGLAASGVPVYALEKRSVIDLAVLEYVCRERGLPDPRAPVGAAARAAQLAAVPRASHGLLRPAHRSPHARGTARTDQRSG